mgnify:CR=1 FL=1
MSEENDGVDLGALSDREILILVASNQKHDRKRLDSHGNRIVRIERILLIGSGVLLAAKAGMEWFTLRVKGQ